jgi:hypothetical protein
VGALKDGDRIVAASGERPSGGRSQGQEPSSGTGRGSRDGQTPQPQGSGR